MSDLTKYSWWGENNAPPPNLKTKKQLAELGLKPVKAVGIIPTKKYELLLYDCDNPESATPKRKASEKQLAALQKGRDKAAEKARYKEWYEDIGIHLKARNEAIRWAKRVLENSQDWVLLDTETTGLYDAEIVQVVIINLSGDTLLDTLVKPTTPIPDEVTAIHGISDEMVVDAPTFPDIYPQIIEILKSKKVLIYNASFDINILRYCCQLHNLPLLGLKERSDCLMLWYAQFVGNWSNYWNDYKWQKLNGGHNALSDCQKALDLLFEMTNSPIETVEQAWENAKAQREKYRQEIGDIPF